MKKILITLAIIFVLLLSLFFYYRCKSKEKAKRFENASTYSQIKPLLRTGDIILFMYIRHESLIGEILYLSRTQLVGSDYGHAGLVYRHNDKVYLIECTDEGHCGEKSSHYFNENNVALGKKRGVRIIDMDILVKEYTKEYDGYFGVKFIDKEIPEDKLINSVNTLANRDFENMRYLFLIMCIDQLFSHKIARHISKKTSANGLFCSELVYTILRDCGVLKPYNEKLFWPNLFTSKLFDELQIVKYSPVVTFRMDNQ